MFPFTNNASLVMILVIAIFLLLCYLTPKQTVSKILCGKGHIQRFSQTPAKNPKIKQQEEN